MLLIGLGVGGFELYKLNEPPPPPAGWKTVRWEAGFGSWGNGGYGVAYDLQIPQDYAFQQKCGTAWVSDDADGPEFTVRMAFRPAEVDRQYDFAVYRKEDGTHIYGRPESSLVIGSPAPYTSGPETYIRRDFSLADVPYLESPSSPRGFGTVTGFWLDGRRLSIISDLREPHKQPINERIVASLTPVPGYNWFHLAAGAIPGLLGC